MNINDNIVYYILFKINYQIQLRVTAKGINFEENYVNTVF